VYSISTPKFENLSDPNISDTDTDSGNNLGSRQIITINSFPETRRPEREAKRSDLVLKLSPSGDFSLTGAYLLTGEMIPFTLFRNAM
jgi:hypothetical protein